MIISKKQPCDIENYRGIALFNYISKVFDYVIICLCEHRLYTFDMQFGFKDNHSTTMYNLVYKETIDYYFNQGKFWQNCIQLSSWCI